MVDKLPISTFHMCNKLNTVLRSLWDRISPWWFQQFLHPGRNPRLVHLHFSPHFCERIPGSEPTKAPWLWVPAIHLHWCIQNGSRLLARSLATFAKSHGAKVVEVLRFWTLFFGGKCGKRVFWAFLRHPDALEIKNPQHEPFFDHWYILHFRKANMKKHAVRPYRLTILLGLCLTFFWGDGIFWSEICRPGCQNHLFLEVQGCH